MQDSFLLWSNEFLVELESQLEIMQKCKLMQQLTRPDVGQRWPCVLRRAALDSVSRVKEVLGSIPPATATEIK